MRKTCFCLLLIFFSLVVFPQGKTSASYAFSFQLHHITLEEAFNELTRLTPYTFSIRPGDLDMRRKVQLSFTNTQIEGILTALLKDTPAVFDISGKVIKIYVPQKGNKKTVLTPIIQNKTVRIRGRVTDVAGLSLPGVNIKIKNSPGGCVSDTEGFFSFIKPDSSVTISFSYIGYQEKEIFSDRTDSSFLFVSLTEKVAAIDEVVVVGYGTQKKDLLLGAVSAIHPGPLKSTPVANFSNALVGHIPGLIGIQNTGQPGRDGSAIFIRGINTFDAMASQPVILVDGVVRTINHLNASDIASVTILKDAINQALYGMRSANGIILVTTHRGKTGKPIVEFNSQTGLQSIVKPPVVLNALQSAELWNEAYYSDFGEIYYSPRQLESIRQVMTGTAPPDTLLRYPNINWFDKVLKPVALQQNYHLNISGGSKNILYYVSGDYINQGGLFRDFKKYHGNRTYNSNFEYQHSSLRVNLDIKRIKNLDLKINLAGNLSSVNSPGIEENQAEMLFQMLYGLGSLSAPVEYPGQGLSNIKLGTNPIGILSQSGYRNEVGVDLTSSVAASYKLDRFLKGLSTKISFSYDVLQSYIKKYTEKYATFNREWHPGVAALYTQVSVAEPLSFVEECYLNSGRSYFDIGVEYEIQKGSHHLTALTLFNKEIYRTDAVAPFAYQGALARVTYDYAGKYLSEFDVSYNGSENFYRTKRYGLFPALAFGWVLSKESFLRNFETVNWLKIKTSFGFLGNDKLYTDGKLNRFLYVNDYKESGNVIFGVNGDHIETSIIEGRIANKQVTWEVSRKLNLGVEGRFFRNFLSCNVELYQDKRDNILITRDLTVPAIVGVQLPAVNKGQAVNRGIEVESGIHWSMCRFTGSIAGFYGLSKSKVLSLDEPSSISSSNKREGKRIGQYFGYITDGFFQSLEEIQALDQSALGGVPMIGDRKYKDRNNDHKITSEDMGPIGYSSIPELNYGFSLQLEYAGFDCTLLFQGVGKWSKRYWQEMLFEFATDRSLQPIHLGRWSPFRSAAENASATFPRLHTSEVTRAINSVESDATILNAAFLRFKNAELGYTLPSSCLTQLPVSHIRFFINGLNLFTWDKLKIADPEQSSHNSVYPLQRIINMGVNIRF